MWQILENLYLGDRVTSEDRQRLVGTGITHILNVARELPCCFPSEFRYLKLELADPDPDFADHIPAICAFIDEGRRQGKVLVHCFAGVSRSPAAILAYLCHHLNQTPAEAWRILSRRVMTNPDRMLITQLETFFADRIPARPPEAAGAIPMNRADAYALLTEYVKDQSLVRHCLAVEAVMRAYARKLGEDEEKWGIVGLLHDFDYERWPDPPNHPLKGSEILRERGYPEDVIYAIKSHADYLPDCPRLRPIEKALYACDELAGLITATALLRPGGEEA